MSVAAEFLSEVITDQGTVATDRLAELLHVTKAELALATGLSRDAASKQSRLRSRQTQARLRDTVEIINRVTPWTGSVGRAFAWFRSQPLPSFGDKTAEELVKEGRVQALKDYLACIAEGGYA
jgi:hypothetical protein